MMMLCLWQRNASLEQELSEQQARYTDAVSARTSVEHQLLSTQTALEELRSTNSQCTELIRDSEGLYVCVCVSVCLWVSVCLCVCTMFFLLLSSAFASCMSSLSWLWPWPCQPGSWPWSWSKALALMLPRTRSVTLDCLVHNVLRV